MKGAKNLEWLELIKLILSIIVVPLTLLIFKMNNRIIVLETNNQNKSDYYKKLFENDEKFLAVLNDLNTEIKIIQSQLKRIK